MAQTQTQNVEREAPVNGVDNSDDAAWCKAAEARKYRVHEGKVYSYGSGMIFHLPAIPGFAAIAAGVQPFVFQAVAQMATNRIGQTQDGDVSAKIAKVLTTGEGTPGAQSNDAFDSAYIDHIESLLTAKLGPHTHKDGVELKGDDLKTAKAARDKLIVDSAARTANREKYFAAATKAAIERASNVPSSGKKTRTVSAKTDSGMEL